MVTDPPGEGAALTARLLTAPTLAVELARRGVTVEVGVLAEAEFWSVYQPIVSLADRSVVAHEALLRGVVDGREVGGGDLFFVAEQAGWLHRLDRIGRESAIAGAVPWLGDDDLFVNFNPTSIYRPQVCLASTERVVHETGIEPRAAGLRGRRVARHRRPRPPGLDPRPLPLAGLAGRPRRRRRRLVEPVAAGRRPARGRQARQGAGAGAARRRRAHRAHGRHRPGPPARRRRRRRGRRDRAARRGGRPRWAPTWVRAGCSAGPVRPEPPVEEPGGPVAAGRCAAEGQCSAPPGEHRAGVLVSEHPVAAGGQREERAASGGRPSQRAVSTRSTWPWATRATSPSASRAAPGRAPGPPARRPPPASRPASPRDRAVPPQRPRPAELRADLGRRPALVAAVVDLDQVLVDPRRRQPGQLGRAPRRCRGLTHTSTNGPAGQRLPQVRPAPRPPAAAAGR